MNGPISTIDMNGGPLYKRVKLLLTQSLAAGEWKPNEAIPSEARLAEQFDVSIGTVRKAIDELTAERILVRQQGRGTFVAAHSQNRFLYQFYHVVDENGVKQLPTPELLQFRRIRAEAQVAAHLGIEKGSRVIHVRNLLCMSGKPVEVNDIYLDGERFETLTREIFGKRPGTIYQLFQDRFAVNIIRTQEQLRAVAVAAPEARLLDLEESAPVLRVDRIAYTYHADPVEYRCSLVNTTHHVYQSDQEVKG